MVTMKVKFRVRQCPICGNAFYGTSEQKQCGLCSRVDISLKRLAHYSILDDYEHPPLWR